MSAVSPVMVLSLASFFQNLILFKNLIKTGAKIKASRAAKAEKRSIFITLKVNKVKIGII